MDERKKEKAHKHSDTLIELCAAFDRQCSNSRTAHINSNRISFLYLVLLVFSEDSLDFQLIK